MEELHSSKRKNNSDRKTLSVDEVVTYNLFSPLLLEHEFEENLYTFGINTICTVLQKFRQDNPKKCDDKHLAKMAILVSRKGIGSLAFTFKSIFKQSIEAEDYEEIKRLFTDSSHQFDELFDNQYLSEKNTEYMKSLYDKEFHSFIKAISSLRKNHILPDHTCQTSSTIMDKKGFFKLYGDCYDEVCFSEREVTGRSAIDDILDQADIPAEQIYAVDGDEPELFCFKLEELLEGLIEEPPFNFRSGKPFTSHAYERLKDNFAKEIAMYLRFVDNCDE